MLVELKMLFRFHLLWQNMKCINHTYCCIIMKSSQKMAVTGCIKTSKFHPIIQGTFSSTSLIVQQKKNKPC